jgi:hypothetical protein
VMCWRKIQLADHGSYSMVAAEVADEGRIIRGIWRNGEDKAKNVGRRKGKADLRGFAGTWVGVGGARQTGAVNTAGRWTGGCKRR